MVDLLLLELLFYFKNMFSLLKVLINSSIQSWYQRHNSRTWQISHFRYNQRPKLFPSIFIYTHTFFNSHSLLQTVKYSPCLYYCNSNKIGHGTIFRSGGIVALHLHPQCLVPEDCEVIQLAVTLTHCSFCCFAYSLLGL